MWKGIINFCDQSISNNFQKCVRQPGGRRSVSGFVGVQWRKDQQKWKATIWSAKEKKQVFLGNFEDKFTAAKAVNAQCRQWGIPLKNPQVKSDDKVGINKIVTKRIKEKVNISFMCMYLHQQCILDVSKIHIKKSWKIFQLHFRFKGSILRDFLRLFSAFFLLKKIFFVCAVTNLFFLSERRGGRNLIRSKSLPKNHWFLHTRE